MPKLEVTMKVDKVTPGTVRYREINVAQNPELKVFPVVYIRKEAAQLLGVNPDTIKVTIETV